jgi:hypothetical protein
MTELSEEEEWFINHWNDILTYPTISDLSEALAEPADVLSAKYKQLRRRRIPLLDRRDRRPPPVKPDEVIPDEQWVSAIGYDDCYEVSDYGRVRSINRIVNTGHSAKRRIKGRVLKPLLTNSGYQVVNLSVNSVTQQKTVHRLVLASFTGLHDNLYVRHKDGNSVNNKLSNLEWGTHRENMDDQMSHYDEVALTLLDHFDDS